MIPKIIHQVWIGKRIPDDLKVFMNTVRETNPDWEYRLWDNDSLAYLLQYIGSKFKRLDRLSDVLRVKLLAEYGGIYVDCDCIALKPFDDLRKYDFFAYYQQVGKKKRRWIENAFMGSLPSGNTIKRLSASLDKAEQDTDTIRITREVIAKCRDRRNRVLPYYYCVARRVFDKSYILHLFANTWKEA